MALGLISNRRKLLTICVSLFVVFLLYTQWPIQRVHSSGYQPPSASLPKVDLYDGRFHWANLQQHYPVKSFRPLPQPSRNEIPKIQHDFNTESSEYREQRLGRLQAVKDNFIHAFRGYEKHAWLQDEVAPLSGRSLNPFGGWAASLVDSLGITRSNAMPQEQAYKICRYSMDNGNERRV
jgi:mannosyl-oligosaccharide alpha-1,2-mannosidase